MKATNKAGRLRIIGGKWRSRVLEFPATEGLRPTSSRIRETLFNWLQDKVPGANCLDLFAGSGACGIEALSRGASRVDFVEINRQAVEVIEKNLGKLEASNANVIRANVLKWLESELPEVRIKYDLVFIDPPYDAKLIDSSCKLLEGSGVLKEDAFVYTESDEKLTLDDLPRSWTIEKEKKAGAVYYYLFRRQG